MRVMASSFLRFLDHTQWCTTVGGTPLDKWSAHRRDLYLTTHNTHNRQTSMPPVGFEPTISVGERSQTYALDRAATNVVVSWWHKGNFGFRQSWKVNLLYNEECVLNCIHILLSSAESVHPKECCKSSSTACWSYLDWYVLKSTTLKSLHS